MAHAREPSPRQNKLNTVLTHCLLKAEGAWASPLIPTSLAFILTVEYGSAHLPLRVTAGVVCRGT